MTRSASCDEKAAQESGDPLASPDVEMAEHAVIERNDHARGQHPEIAGMRVGVEEAEFEDLLEQNPRTADGDLLRCDSHRSNAVEIVDRNPLDELHREHARRAQIVEDQRYVHRAIVGELEPAALDRAAFPREVELALDRALEFACHGERPVDGQVRKPAFDELGEVLDDVQIGLNDLGDFGPLNFQGHHPPVVQDGPVDLGDRSRGHRLFVERGEDLAERAAVFLVQDRFDLAERECSYVVAQEGQLVRVRLGQQIGPAC